MKKVSSYLILIILLFTFSINVLGSTKEYTDITKFVPDTETLKEQVQNSIIVFEGYTKQELITKINNSLNSTISNKGELIVTTCLEKNVNPFLATAIMLHETGCSWSCSSLVVNCNNVGGQRGTGCNGWKYYSTLDEGITGLITFISEKYVANGKTTAETMTGYAANTEEWAKKVNKYIEQIKSA